MKQGHGADNYAISINDRIYMCAQLCVTRLQKAYLVMPEWTSLLTGLQGLHHE
jgi:hypothetical protein